MSLHGACRKLRVPDLVFSRAVPRHCKRRAVQWSRVQSTLAPAHAVRGGSCDDPASALCSVRRFSSRARVHAGASVMDGLAVSAKLLDEVTCRAAAYRKRTGKPVGLSVVMVGERPDSAKYVRLKVEKAAQAGLASSVQRFHENVTEEEVLGSIDRLNNDNDCHGILVQLPLPSHLDQARVLNRVKVTKDVDGFHPYNVGCLALKSPGTYAPWESVSGSSTAYPIMKEGGRGDSQESDFKGIIPHLDMKWHGHVACTPQACIELLKHYKVPIKDRHAVVLGRSNIVGMPVSLLLLHHGATVSNVSMSASSSHIQQMASQADILVSAVGSPLMVKQSWVKAGAAVLDVGINFVPLRTSSLEECDPDASAIGRAMKLVGDVDFEGVSQVAGHISPVPGGVGPMTVSMLLVNTVTNAELSLINES